MSALRVALLTTDGGGGSIATRLREGGMDVRLLNCCEVRKLGSAGFAAVVVPGGDADKFKRLLGTQGLDRIKQFVEAGGGYLGICAGAYLGVHWDSDWKYCGLLPGVTVDTRADGRRGVIDPCRLQTTPDGMSLSAGRFGGTISRSYYSNGPVFTSHANTKVLLRFDAETRKHGFQSMRGTPAALAGTCGHGRVILISPHLEGWEEHRAGLCNFVRWTAGIGETPALSRSGSWSETDLSALVDRAVVGATWTCRGRDDIHEAWDMGVAQKISSQRLKFSYRSGDEENLDSKRIKWTALVQFLLPVGYGRTRSRTPRR